MGFALRSVLLPLFMPPPKKSSSWLRAGAEHARVLGALGEIDLVPTSRAVATGHGDVGLAGRLLGSLWGHLRTSVPSLHFRQGFTSLSLHVPICKMEMTLEGPLKCVVLGHSCWAVPISGSSEVVGDTRGLPSSLSSVSPWLKCPGRAT